MQRAQASTSSSQTAGANLARGAGLITSARVKKASTIFQSLVTEVAAEIQRRCKEGARDWATAQLGLSATSGWSDTQAQSKMAMAMLQASMRSNDTVCHLLDNFTGIFATTLLMVNDPEWQAENRKDWSSAMKQIEDELNEQRSISKGYYGHLLGAIASRGVVKSYGHDEESAQSYHSGVLKAGEAATIYAVAAQAVAEFMEEDVGNYFPSAQESMPKLTSPQNSQAAPSASTQGESANAQAQTITMDADSVTMDDDVTIDTETVR
jgi:hypothetical protein